jgi:hypothetical protein
MNLRLLRDKSGRSALAIDDTDTILDTAGADLVRTAEATAGQRTNQDHCAQ